MGRLFWKIFFGFWITMILVGSIVGTIIWSYNSNRIAKLELLINNPRVDMQITSIANVLQYAGEDAVKEILERRQLSQKRLMPIFIVNDKGDDLLNRPVSSLMIDKAHDTLTNPQQTAVQQVTTPQGNQYLLFVSRHNHPSMYKPLFSRQPPLLPLLIPFIASLFFSLGLTWYLTRPIRLMSEATNHFANGNLGVRVMPKLGSRKDEITDLGEDFDYMAGQIQKLINAQKNLLNDVSHELRSPLARLQMAVELIRQQPQRVMELLKRVEKESGRLDELVGELLTLSRIEAGVLENELDYFDINGLISTVVSDANFEVVNQNKEVIFHSDREVLIEGHVELLRRAIENIVRNALFYTPEQSRVNVSLTHKNFDLVITICDMGVGVPKEKLEQLFQPFVRINEINQNAKIPGYGLGLAIAKRAVEIHGGSISGYNQSEGGLCIAIVLPIKQQSSKFSDY